MSQIIVQDPAFWYAVSFFIFISIAVKKGSKILSSTLENYQESIERKFKEAENLFSEAVQEKELAEKKLNLWPKEKDKRQKAYQDKKDALKKAFHEKFDRLEKQRKVVANMYLNSKEQESQKRLESHIAKRLVLDLKKKIQ